MVLFNSAYTVYVRILYRIISNSDTFLEHLIATTYAYGPTKFSVYTNFMIWHLSVVVQF